jgi:hypothetical protein
MAGVMGAKEGEACGTEDSDTCGVSLYKASPIGGIGGWDVRGDWPGPEGPRGLRVSSPWGLSPLAGDTWRSSSSA